MRWVRVNRRFGAWAALFALAIQITLSFGHIHADELGLSPNPAKQVRVQADAGGGTGKSHHSGANDVRAICAVLALVASSIVPTPAPLILPVAVRHSWTPAVASAPGALQARDYFQSRAPPL